MLRSDLITIDPEITGGTPVFTDTRVPISRLFSYLRHGHPLAEFLVDYPTVEEQAERVLDSASAALLPAQLRVKPAQIAFSYTEQPHETAAWRKLAQQVSL